MKTLHTLTIGLQFLLLATFLTACQDDDAPGRLQEVTPAFSWEGTSFYLDMDNNWSLTRFKDHIALTNFTLKCQILLSWNGNMATGEKTDAVLKIAEAGKKLQTVRLDKLLVEDIDGMYYSLQFSKEGSEGAMVFSK